MNPVNPKRVMEGVGLFLGSLIALFFIWYVYFVLKRASLSAAIFASLFFGAGLLAGPVLLTIRQDSPRWFVIDFEHLSKGQGALVAVGALMFAVSFLWVAVSQEIRVFFEQNFGNGISYLFFRAITVVGFFYFSWQSFTRLKHVFHRPRN